VLAAHRLARLDAFIDECRYQWREETQRCVTKE